MNVILHSTENTFWFHQAWHELYRNRPNIYYFWKRFCFFSPHNVFHRMLEEVKMAIWEGNTSFSPIFMAFPPSGPEVWDFMEWRVLGDSEVGGLLNLLSVVAGKRRCPCRTLEVSHKKTQVIYIGKRWLKAKAFSQILSVENMNFMHVKSDLQIASVLYVVVIICSIKEWCKWNMQIQ